MHKKLTKLANLCKLDGKLLRSKSAFITNDVGLFSAHGVTHIIEVDIYKRYRAVKRISVGYDSFDVISSARINDTAVLFCQIINEE